MTAQDLRVEEKVEHPPEGGEKTETGRFYIPQTDIHESADALFIAMDMPGVSKDNVDIRLEKNVLTITGSIDFSSYENLKPIYTEYNVGNYARSFTVSSEIDKENISATMTDGVLSLHLPKAKEAATKKIKVQ